jgi:hypothetical protein
METSVISRLTRTVIVEKSCVIFRNSKFRETAFHIYPIYNFIYIYLNVIYIYITDLNGCIDQNTLEQL